MSSEGPSQCILKSGHAPPSKEKGSPFNAYDKVDKVHCKRSNLFILLTCRPADLHTLLLLRNPACSRFDCCWEQAEQARREDAKQRQRDKRGAALTPGQSEQCGFRKSNDAAEAYLQTCTQSSLRAMSAAGNTQGHAEAARFREEAKGGGGQLRALPGSSNMFQNLAGRDEEDARGDGCASA